MALAPSNRCLKRTKNNDTNTINRNGGGSGGRLGGSSKQGDDLRNSRFQGGDLQQTKSESPNKDKGISICDKLELTKKKIPVRKTNKSTYTCSTQR